MARRSVVMHNLEVSGPAPLLAQVRSTAGLAGDAKD